MKKGTLIVIEGLDGSGKATQARLLADYLLQSGKQAMQIAFPAYESKSSALVKMYLSGEIGTLEVVNAYAASSFYAADRYISYQTNWKNSYQAGHTIVVDRYTTSNAAHQMSKLPRAEWDDYLCWMQDFEYGRLGLPQPDMVLYLDMHPETSRRLLEKRYGGDEGKQDIHEKDLAYLLRCRQAALYAGEKLGWRMIPCCDGKEPLAIEEIARKIRTQL